MVIKQAIDDIKIEAGILIITLGPRRQHASYFGVKAGAHSWIER